MLTPPTVSHLLAIHAPPGGRGEYTLDEITDVALTAYTGFHAARREAAEEGSARTIVHTGHWGTGAYGGNRVLMAALQLLAARWAGLDALVFHTVTEAGMEPLNEARALVENTLWPLGATKGPAAVFGSLVARRFLWGVSDGN